MSLLDWAAMGAKTERPNREPPVVLDVEGDRVSSRDIKGAQEVLEDAMVAKGFERLANRIADEARDEDVSLTRAARDRDRATPRDVSRVDSERLRGALPAEGVFRGALSGYQRKLRSAQKNRVMAAAPRSQHQAVHAMLTDENPQQWSSINAALHNAAGDAQDLDDAERKTVQRLDRAIQSFERLNDRTHKVYVSVQLPAGYGPITKPEDLPANLQPGAAVAFDQFTLTKHNLHETPGHDSSQHLVFEIVTSRGMYLGRSDSIEDTTHVLPRGIQAEVVNAQFATYETKPGGFDERLVIQLREQ